MKKRSLTIHEISHYQNEQYDLEECFAFLRESEGIIKTAGDNKEVLADTRREQLRYLASLFFYEEKPIKRALSPNERTRLSDLIHLVTDVAECQVLETIELEPEWHHHVHLHNTIKNTILTPHCELLDTVLKDMKKWLERLKEWHLV